MSPELGDEKKAAVMQFGIKFVGSKMKNKSSPDNSNGLLFIKNAFLK